MRREISQPRFVPYIYQLTEGGCFSRNQKKTQNTQKTHLFNPGLKRLPSLQQMRCRILLQEVDEQEYVMCTGFKDGPMEGRGASTLDLLHYGKHMY